MLNFNLKSEKDRRGNYTARANFESTLALKIFADLLSSKDKDLLKQWITILQDMDAKSLEHIENKLQKLDSSGKKETEEYYKFSDIKDHLLKHPINIEDPLLIVFSLQGERRVAFEDMLETEWTKEEYRHIKAEYSDVRKNIEFQGTKGRKSLSDEDKKSRPPESNNGRNFGISTTENTPQELMTMFLENISHAKGLFTLDSTSEVGKKMAERGYPYIAGASGSLAMILSYLKLKKLPKEQIEKLAIPFMASIIGAGHHSLVELLMAAKRYNLFDGIKHPLDYTGDNAYESLLGDLSKEMERLGYSQITANTISNLSEFCKVILQHSKPLHPTKKLVTPPVSASSIYEDLTECDETSDCEDLSDYESLTDSEELSNDENYTDSEYPSKSETDLIVANNNILTSFIRHSQMATAKAETTIDDQQKPAAIGYGR